MGDVDILFVDKARKYEIDMFYEACQRHRDYYRGRPKCYHPLTFFRESSYTYQCPPDMTESYLNFPSYYVKYKYPAVIPNTVDRTSRFPSLPGRTLAGRYNKNPCLAYIR